MVKKQRIQNLKRFSKKRTPFLNVLLRVAVILWIIVAILGIVAVAKLISVINSPPTVNFRADKVIINKTGNDTYIELCNPVFSYGDFSEIKIYSLEGCVKP